MRTAILKRLDALETSLSRKTLQPIALIDVDSMDPADRNAYWSGDDSILCRYGMPEASPSDAIHTIVIDVHESRRGKFLETADLDDEELERVEQRRELAERRRESEARQRAQLEAIQKTQADRPRLPPAPGNAYSPLPDPD